jgi:hypothetical protein
VSRLIFVVKDSWAIALSDIEGAPIGSPENINIMSTVPREKFLAIEVIAVK